MAKLNIASADSHPSLALFLSWYLSVSLWCIFVFGTASLSILTQRCLSISEPSKNARRGVAYAIGWRHFLPLSVRFFTKFVVRPEINIHSRWSMWNKTTLNGVQNVLTYPLKLHLVVFEITWLLCDSMLTNLTCQTTMFKKITKKIINNFKQE